MTRTRDVTDAPSEFRTPPLPGVTCECEPACACDLVDTWEATCTHARKHRHVHPLGATCDACTGIPMRIETDVFAYTSTDALREFASYAAARGWTVDGDRYICPYCTKRGRR